MADQNTTPTRPRIAIMVSHFPEAAETFVVDKAVGLLQRGWDVQIVAGDSDPAGWSSFPELEDTDFRARLHLVRSIPTVWDKTTRIPRAMARTAGRPATWRYLRDARAPWRTRVRRWYLDETLIRLRPDIVHFEFGAHAVGRTHLRRLLGARLVVSFRGYDLNIAGLDSPDYFADVWAETDAVHVVSRALWERALERGCPPAKRHVLIPGGIDTRVFTPAAPAERGPPSADRPLQILSVGRLTWEKGYVYALQAVRRLVDRGVPCRYRILGGGNADEILYTRSDLGLEDVVDLTGAVDPEDVRSALRETDVYLHASVSEGFPIAVLEAQAMRVPVVCSDAGGLPENVVDESTGFVVPRREPAALAERLERLARDPGLRHRMGAAGRRRVEGGFTKEAQAAAFDRLYRELLGLPVPSTGAEPGDGG